MSFVACLFASLLSELFEVSVNLGDMFLMRKLEFLLELRLVSLLIFISLILCACMCTCMHTMCTQDTWESEDGSRSPATGVILDDCELPCECRKLNLGPLREPSVLLITELATSAALLVSSVFQLSQEVLG